MSSPQFLLYWLHTLDQSDIYTQGYVGITSVGFKLRLQQHQSRTRKGKYPKNFTDGIQSNLFIGEVICYGTEAEIKALENHFRPSWNIGWNRAIGGEGGGVVKHGLTGSPAKPIYYNMLTTARNHGDEVTADWLGEGGLEKFCQDMFPKPIGLKLWRKDRSLPFSKENCIWVSQKEVCRNNNSGGLVEWEGRNYTYTELSEMSGLKANTIQYRVRRGWSIEEALGHVPRKKRMVEALDGSEVPYSGKLTDEELHEMLNLRIEGHSTVMIGSAFGIDPGQVSRLCTRLGYSDE